MIKIDDLTELERVFGLALPEPYRQFLLNYPVKLLETKLDLGWTKESPGDRQLRNDVSGLAQLNRCVRLPNTPWTEDDGPWPEFFFVIGDDQCGNYWAVDTRHQDAAVYFYDHELGKFEKQHDSLEKFADGLLKEIREFNEKYGRQ
jgi:hypothetical protein